MGKDRIDAEVFVTDNHAKFHIRDENRSINIIHLRKLITAITKRNLLYSQPIIVDRQFNVLDGQHRLIAAQRLGVPIYYIVRDMSMADVPIINAHNKPWALDDYLNYYCLKEAPAYLELKSFIEKHNVTTSVGLHLAMGIRNRDSYTQFKEGTFSFSLEHAEHRYNMIKDFAQFYPNWLRRVFIIAVLSLIDNESYDHTTMPNKLRTQSTRLVDCVTAKDYVRLLQSIYNYKNKLPVIFVNR